MAIKALVVDNNAVFLKAVSTMLEQEGCAVRCAGTGLEALQLLASYDPEVVFTDLIMPLVDGEQLCRILRQTPRHRHVFLVVLSAIIAEDEERILRDTGCDMCIAKGGLTEMRAHLREALHVFRERQGGGGENRRLESRRNSGIAPLEVTRELLSEKRHLAAILANLAQGIVETSGDGRIVAVNRAALEMLGVGEELLIGRDFATAIPWGELGAAVRNWVGEQLVGGGRGQLEISEELPLRLNGRIIVGSLLVVAEDEDFFGLCFLSDITRQYQAEEHGRAFDDAIRLVKKMDAMSIMAGGVAHDFNNLLTVICGNLDIVAFYGARQSGEERAKLLEQARRAALAAVDLTRQISCFSNLGIVNREAVAIAPLVQRAVDEFFAREGATCTLRLADRDAMVYADGVELRQALVNVLRNAVEAGSGRPIEVDLGRVVVEEPRLVSGQYLSAGSYVQIDIRDYGRGIDPQYLFRIFDPYYSTKERGALKGMGLGLTVVYATLRNHGGHVVVQSRPQEGSVVSLYLPVYQFVPQRAEGSGPQRDAGKRALIVDPDANMREIGRIMLAHLGYQVTLAAGRDEALAEARRLVGDTGQGRPLVFLDLSSEHGESAVETCRLLHEIDAGLPVIAMSGSILEPVMGDCRRHGFVNSLAKPYTIDSLRHVAASAGALPLSAGPSATSRRT